MAEDNEEGGTGVMPSVFISYSRIDEDFVLRLAKDLTDNGIAVWTDKKMLVGDSLTREIADAIIAQDYFIFIMSPVSVTSAWCLQELEIALTHQLEIRKNKVLPIAYADCRAPNELRGKLALNFTHTANYDESLAALFERIGVVPPQEFPSASRDHFRIDVEGSLKFVVGLTAGILIEKHLEGNEGNAPKLSLSEIEEAFSTSARRERPYEIRATEARSPASPKTPSRTYDPYQNE